VLSQALHLQLKRKKANQHVQLQRCQRQQRQCPMQLHKQNLSNECCQSIFVPNRQSLAVLTA
jgi:hypothetical protein